MDLFIIPELWLFHGFSLACRHYKKVYGPNLLYKQIYQR